MRYSGMRLKDWYVDVRYRVRRVWSYFVRGYHGVAPIDTWSFNTYVAEVLAKGFLMLAEHPHGCPFFIAEEYGLEVDEHGAPLDIDKGVECWQKWLREKAEWLKWYAADDIPLTEDMTQEEKIAALDAYDKRHETFKTVVLPNIVKNFEALWD